MTLFTFSSPAQLCDLVVRVPCYRSRDPGFDFRRYQIFWEVVGLERGPLSLVGITKKGFEWKVTAPGLEVRVPGYRYRDPGFHSRRYQIVWEVVGLERCPPSLVSITEELLEWKSNGSGSRKPRLTAMGIRYADHATHSIRKSWY
jgi:hypothetical protein